MPGITKRKYNAEIARFSKSLTRPLTLIVETLKPGYTKENLLDSFKLYYPYEWNLICERYQVYKGKDKFLVKNGKKKRYNPDEPEVYFYSLPKIKNLLSNGFREKHKQHYDEDHRLKCEIALQKNRKKKIEKRKASIEAYTRMQQIVDPGFIDALVYAYHGKVSVNEKLEICNEIQKYDCDKTWDFFWKQNDSEKNDEIRKYAYQVLQKSGHYVKLRKRFIGKKKAYMVEKSSLVYSPETLANKLRNNDYIQTIKTYDLFISHSYRDKSIVEDIVHKMNSCGLNCYVDWTADKEFLKRSLVSDYTKEVLKARMEQSRKLLYVSSSNSRNSYWVDFELQYYQDEVQNEILMVVLDGEDNHSFREIEQEKIESYFSK